MAANPAPLPDDFRLIHPEDYAAYGYPHHVWTQLRAQDPVSWQTQPGSAKHADITEIGKRPEDFISGPRIVIQPVEEEISGFPVTLIQMDPPMHGDFRQQISRRFTPRMLK